MGSTGIPWTVVDGQRLLVPDDAALAALVEAPELDGRPVGVGRILARYVALAERFTDVRVALGEAREPGMPWIVYHLVRDAGGAPVRVHLESQVCDGAPGCSGVAFSSPGRRYSGPAQGMRKSKLRKSCGSSTGS